MLLLKLSNLTIVHVEFPQIGVAQVHSIDSNTAWLADYKVQEQQ
jgi:hypothetical protein